MSGPLAYFAMFGVLICAIPWVALGGIASLVLLHFKYGISLWWCVIPAFVFIAWAVVMWAANRR